MLPKHFECYNCSLFKTVHLSQASCHVHDFFQLFLDPIRVILKHFHTLFLFIPVTCSFYCCHGQGNCLRCTIYRFVLQSQSLYINGRHKVSLKKNGDCSPLSLESSPGYNFLLVLTFSFSFMPLFLARKHFALLSSFNTLFC